MNLQEIKEALQDGKKVYWASKAYEVIKDKIGQYLIVCVHNQYTIGLTHQDGTTLNGKEEDFFAEEYPTLVDSKLHCDKCYTWVVKNHDTQEVSMFATEEQAENYIHARIGSMQRRMGAGTLDKKHAREHFFTIYRAETASEIHKVSDRLWYEKRTVPEELEMLITTNGDASVGIRPEAITVKCHSVDYTDPVLVNDAKKIFKEAVQELFDEGAYVQTMKEIEAECRAQSEFMENAHMESFQDRKEALQLLKVMDNANICTIVNGKDGDTTDIELEEWEADLVPAAEKVKALDAIGEEFSVVEIDFEPLNNVLTFTLPKTRDVSEKREKLIHRLRDWLRQC